LNSENNILSEPRCPQGEGRPVDNRRTEVVRLYAIEAVKRGNPRSASAYMAKARATADANPDLDRWLDMFPDAPADAVAAWLHGEKGSMAYYDRADEIAARDDPVLYADAQPATVTDIRSRTA
jgi:hypothetical protein